MDSTIHYRRWSSLALSDPKWAVYGFWGLSQYWGIAIKTGSQINTLHYFSWYYEDQPRVLYNHDEQSTQGLIIASYFSTSTQYLPTSSVAKPRLFILFETSPLVGTDPNWPEGSSGASGPLWQGVALLSTELHWSHAADHFTRHCYIAILLQCYIATVQPVRKVKVMAVDYSKCESNAPFHHRSQLRFNKCS